MPSTEQMRTIISAQLSLPEPGVRFAPVHIYLDSGDRSLAAYQFELKATAGQIEIVGVEAGEHKAFSEPPYYDPAALAKDRMKELQKKGFKDANVYGFDQMGGLHSIYVLCEKQEIFGLPKNPKSKAELDGIKRQGKEKYAAWQRERGEKLASVGGAGGALAAAGLAAAGLKKLADRKAERAREEAAEKS